VHLPHRLHTELLEGAPQGQAGIGMDRPGVLERQHERSGVHEAVGVVVELLLILFALLQNELQVETAEVVPTEEDLGEGIRRTPDANALSATRVRRAVAMMWRVRLTSSPS